MTLRDINSGSVCVFVASSDNTLDVFLSVSQSFAKFWPNCAFPIYVGLNTYRNLEEGSVFHQVCAPATGWRSELAEQLKSLPNSITHILLFLDDFLLLEPVNDLEINQLIFEAQTEGLKYLRFVPYSRAFIPFLFCKICAVFKPLRKRIIPSCIPYYSSLQVALWQKDHLQNMLSVTGSIWEFEHRSLIGIHHYAVEDISPIKYVHVVEKGKWKRTSHKIFRDAGIPFLPGARPFLSFLEQLNLGLNKIKFSLIGYSYVRLKRVLVSLQKKP